MAFSSALFALACAPYAARAAMQQPQCDKGAITCLEVISTATENQNQIALTFGQPFKAGDLPKGAYITARDGSNDIPMQMDEIASGIDGSVQFAVLSIQIADLKAGEKRTINLFARKEAPHIATAPPNPLSPSSRFDLSLSATVYSPQISLLTFGNRNGHAPGIPFETGEEITLILGGQSGAQPAEEFKLITTPDLAGGAFPSLTKIAEHFRDLINTRSSQFRAYKVGEGGGYERLWITARIPDAPGFPVHVRYSGKARIQIDNQRTYQPPATFEANPAERLSQMIKSGADARLRGPVAVEYTIVTPFIEKVSGKEHPQLTARIHARFAQDPTGDRHDVALENNWTFQPNSGNLVYDSKISRGGKVVRSQPAFTHYHHARWHTLVRPQGAPQVRLVHNMPYFFASHATWNYALDLDIPESVLAEEAARLAKRSNDPMDGAFITPYFPTTGGRPEIGPLPRWTALYLITQDERARASMLANADAAATIPIHYRDKDTDNPVDLDRHPGIALRIGQAKGRDALPPTNPAETPWTPDTAHQGSFAFIPYLVTGDRYYLDETLFWASWNLAAMNPDYREQAKGLIHANEIRGQAWALRSISEATYALPDKDPQQRYYRNILRENLKWYVERYPNNPMPDAVSPLGAMEQGDKFGQTAPWQNDFMALVVGLIAQRRDTQAKTYFDWLSRFTVGRFTHEEEGFCRFRAPGYWIRIRDMQGNPIRTWEDLYESNWPHDAPCTVTKPLDGNPSSPSSYVAYARAALALAKDVNEKNAVEASAWLALHTAAIRELFSKDPTWAIVPQYKTPSSARPISNTSQQ